jgi:hypothetical protein
MTLIGWRGGEGGIKGKEGEVEEREREKNNNTARHGMHQDCSFQRVGTWTVRVWCLGVLDQWGEEVDDTCGISFTLRYPPAKK